MVFEGEIGSDEFGNMAIDDIRLALDEKCDLAPPEAAPNYNYSMANCNFDDDFCDWLSSDEGKHCIL